MAAGTFVSCTADQQERIRGTDVIMKPMGYQQVKERVDREDKVLKKLVIQTGIGMLAALLITIAFVR